MLNQPFNRIFLYELKIVYYIVNRLLDKNDLVEEYFQNVK